MKTSRKLSETTCQAPAIQRIHEFQVDSDLALRERIRKQRLGRGLCGSIEVNWRDEVSDGIDRSSNYDESSKILLRDYFLMPKLLAVSPFKGTNQSYTQSIWIIYYMNTLCHVYTRILVLATVLDSWGRGRFEWHGMIEHSERNKIPGETFSPT